VPAPESLDLCTAAGQARAAALGLLPAPQASPAAGEAQSPPRAKKARRRKLRPREKDVLRQCLQYLRARGIMCWRQNAGAFPLGEGKRRRYFRACEPGCSDIVGCVAGRLLTVEVKRPGGRLRPAQAAFLDRVRAAGGVALCVDSVAALAKALDAEGL
jgi:hypothetical protein